MASRGGDVSVGESLARAVDLEIAEREVAERAKSAYRRARRTPNACRLPGFPECWTRAVGVEQIATDDRDATASATCMELHDRDGRLSLLLKSATLRPVWRAEPKLVAARARQCVRRDEVRERRTGGAPITAAAVHLLSSNPALPPGRIESGVDALDEIALLIAQGPLHPRPRMDAPGAVGRDDLARAVRMVHRDTGDDARF